MSEIGQEITFKRNVEQKLTSALELLIKGFKEKSHFFYELLQNAEDAKATKIRFRMFDDALAVFHDGTPFTMDNLERLCDIGYSDKPEDGQTIGKFGLGFKSVFGICKTVHLHSAPPTPSARYPRLDIEIRGFTHAICIEPIKVPAGYTTLFILPFAVGERFSSFDSLDELRRVLGEKLRGLKMESLLFMRHLREISYQFGNAEPAGFTIQRSKDKKTRGTHVTLHGLNDADRQDFLCFSSPCDEAPGRTLDIAFPLDVQGRVVKPKKTPPVFVYFPTGEDSHFNFIVQGPFRTTSDREKVYTDDALNKTLADQLATLFYDSVLALKGGGLLTADLLASLPLRPDTDPESDIYQALHQTTLLLFAGAEDGTLPPQPLIPAADGTSFLTAPQALLARGQTLTKVFDNETISALINDDEDHGWVLPDITEGGKYRELHAFLKELAGVQEVSPSDLRDLLNGNLAFLPAQDDAWLIRFYNFLIDYPSLFNDKTPTKNLLTVKLVKTSTDDFVAPMQCTVDPLLRSSHFFSVYGDQAYERAVLLPPSDGDLDEELTFVKPSLYKACPRFFEGTLGLRSPNNYERFVRRFWQTYSADTISVSDKQHCADIKTLLSFLTPYDTHGLKDRFREKPLHFLICWQGENRYYVNPYEYNKPFVYLSQVTEGMDIGAYFRGLRTKIYFVDLDCYEANGITPAQLKALPLQEEIAEGINSSNGVWWDAPLGNPPNWHSTNGLWKDFTLPNLREVLSYIHKHPDDPNAQEKSAFILHTLLRYDNHLHGDIIVNGVTIPNKYNQDAEIIKDIKRADIAWLYTADGRWVKAEEIYVSDLSPEVYGTLKPKSQAYESLGFKKPRSVIVNEVETRFQASFTERDRALLFEEEFKRRYGIPPPQTLASMAPRSAATPSTQGHRVPAFPTSDVRNWESLKTHVMKGFLSAQPVRMEKKMRSVRVSQDEGAIHAYLESHYCTREHAFCQLCHTVTLFPEAVQLEANPKRELPQMNLHLCPICAAKFRALRQEGAGAYKDLLDRLQSLTLPDILKTSPVKVPCGDGELWFTQTHFAEIRLLLALNSKI